MHMSLGGYPQDRDGETLQRANPLRQTTNGALKCGPSFMRGRILIRLQKLSCSGCVFVGLKL